MAIKGCSTLPRAPELNSHHHIEFSVITRHQRFWGGVHTYFDLKNIADVYNSVLIFAVDGRLIPNVCKWKA